MTQQPSQTPSTGRVRGTLQLPGVLQFTVFSDPESESAKQDNAYVLVFFPGRHATLSAEQGQSLLAMLALARQTMPDEVAPAASSARQSPLHLQAPCHAGPTVAQLRMMQQAPLHELGLCTMTIREVEALYTELHQWLDALPRQQERCTLAFVHLTTNDVLHLLPAGMRDRRHPALCGALPSRHENPSSGQWVLLAWTREPEQETVGNPLCPDCLALWNASKHCSGGQG